MNLEPADPGVVDRARKAAKSQLIARAAVIARELSAASERANLAVSRIKDGEEWEGLSAILNELLVPTRREGSAKELVESYLAMRLAETELKYSTIDLARQMDLG